MFKRVASHQKPRISIITFLTLVFALVSISSGTISFSANSSENTKSQNRRQVFEQNKLSLIIGKSVFINDYLSSPEATFVVNDNGDTSDVTVSDNMCLDAAGKCTLRAAIQQANSTPGADEIIFALTTPTVIQLDPALTPKEFVITAPLTITGPGARLLTIQGNTASSASSAAASPESSTGIFNINTTTAVTTTISGLTISNTGGRGINNAGKLNLSDVLIKKHQYGIFNSGSLNLTRALITENSTSGLHMTALSDANVSNTTITENTSGQHGAGVYTLSPNLTLNNVTISHNTSNSGSGGGVYFDAAISGVYVRNTIIAKNTAPTGQDILSVNSSTGVKFVSRGNNLIGISATDIGFVNGTNNDKVGTPAAPVDPLLEPLQNNGGQTNTRALEENSPAKNAGNSCVTNSNCGGNNPPTNFLLTDQRGNNFPRSFETGVDIGAFESFYPTPSVDSLTPENWGTGSGSFELVIDGNNFVEDSVVKFNGQVRDKTFVSNTQLKAQISASDVAAAGEFPVTVTNPAPGGGTTPNFNFKVINCSYTINPNTQDFTSGGGNGSINVTTTNGCPWTATTSATWITINNGADRKGPGSVSFTVAANSGPARNATITVAGQTFNVTQSSGCSYSISPTSRNFTAAGGANSFSLTASNSACGWTAATSDSWITITNATGEGNATINFTVAANTGPARTGTITVAGQTFTVNQDSGCTYTLTPSSANFQAAGGPGNFNVTASAGCSWTATTSDSWITINQGSGSGTGNGTVNFTVAANSGDSRTGSITVNGQTFTVTQVNGCTYTLNPTSKNVEAAGETGSFTISVNSNCQWTAVSNATWITVTGGASGTGNGTVNFTVAANTGPARSGTITAGGQTFTISQANGCTYSINPVSTDIAASGGPSSFAVTASNSSCQWSAASNATWITVTSGASGTGNGTVNFTVAANTGPVRNGTISAAGQTFTVNQASGCTFSINPVSREAVAAGETGSFAVTASNSACQWTAASNHQWITVTGGASGTGNGTVNFTVAANPGPARTGTITAAGQTFTINQASGCVYSLNPTSATVSAAGENGSFTISVNSACGWTAVSNNSWITVTGGASGNGNGTIQFSVAANTGPARSGTITVGGQTFTVNQLNGCTYSINPTSSEITAAGGSGSFAINASNSACSWSAVSNATWLTLTGTSIGSGNGTIQFSVAANTGPARSGTITVGGQTFTVNQLNGCTYSINPISQNFTTAGGNGSIAVTASNSGCAWTAASNNSWITVTSGASGTGNGTVSFTIAANTGPARTGTISVAGRTFTVTQDSGCTYTLSPANTSFTAAGGSGSFNVTTNNSACQWTAVSNNSWITVLGNGSGTGNGEVSFTVQANISPQRTGTISVNGQTFTITQANGCTYAISPTSANVPAGSGTGSFNINSGAGCQWTVQSNASWITVTSTTNGSGSNVVSFSFAANVGPERSGTITAGGQTFTVNQASGCTYSISPTSASLTAAGGNGSVNVTAVAGCVWTATSNASWISITSNNTGSGNGSINFTVAANVSPQRVGTITIGGPTGSQTFSVTQANGCTYTLSSTNTGINENGGQRTFNIVSGPGCPWTAASNDSWITITEGASGTGNGTVKFTVATNSGGGERTGTITAAGQTFTVYQVSLIVSNLNDSGLGSLRKAVANANSTPGDDVITFREGLFGTIPLTTGEIVIENNGKLEIRGNGADLTVISGTNNSRVFYVNEANVTLTNITIRSGNGLGRNSTETDRNGGAIYTKLGFLTLDRVHIDGNNIVVPEVPGAGSRGGGIFFYGGANHVIRNSTISYNKAFYGAGYFSQSGKVTLLNSTISDNTANKEGGAIYTIGDTILRNVTISKNTVLNPSGDGGGIMNQAGALDFGNTIIAGNIGPEITFVTGQFLSAGYNLVGDSLGDANNTGSPPSYRPTDILDVPPRLSILDFYGGTIPTKALLPGSPALNTGSNDLTPAGTDQRGAPRIVNNSTDIGAFENNVTLEPTASTLPNASQNVHYYQQLRATLAGSTNPYEPFEYFMVDGFLPTGITMTQDSGLISGPPEINGTYKFTVKAVSRVTGMAGVNEYILNVGCAYSINPMNQSIPATGGNGNIAVTTNSGCPWTAATNDSWINITGGSTGSGNGTVNFTVGAHNGPARTGTITVAGQTFTVNQANGCTFSLSPSSANMPAGGGDQTFNVTTSNSGCQRTVTSNVEWISIVTGATGTGNGAVAYRVAANPGNARTGIINVSGQNFTVTQDSGCNYTLSANSVNIPVSGGTSSFIVNTGVGCTWTAAVNGNASWVTITSGNSGTGSGTVAFSVAANTGAARSATITAGGKTFTINQGGSAQRTVFDVDGDGMADVAVFRPETGGWYILGSRDGFFAVAFGIATDKPVPADYDGDGKTDIAVFRDGAWYILGSRDGFFAFGFGQAGDIPQPGDYDGDGKADAAVFRPSNGGWYILGSRDGFIAIGFGIGTDKPVAADFDGDGKTDVAVFRNGIWYVLGSRNGFFGVQFGQTGDTPVSADYDGDGKADIAVFRGGAWYILGSRDGFFAVAFGIGTDKPVAADYDGDGKTDVAVFRNGAWYILGTRNGFFAVSFGIGTDMPIPFSLRPQS